MFYNHNILSVEEICRKLKPIFGSKIDDIYLNYKLAQNREARDEIEQMLNVLYRKHLNELLNDEVLLEPPKENNVEGEYPIASVSYAGKNLYNFNLKESDWIRHICITGMSGSGKTNLAFKIIENFIEKNKPFLVFDWKKSFRPLMLADSNILCFTIGNERVANFFKMNINMPPKNVAPKEWLNVLCDLITECFNASFGVHKMISETLDEAFKDAGVYSGSNDYPTWYEIKFRLEEKIKEKKGREANWLESALRIAHVMTFGDFAKTINCKGEKSLSVDKLLDKKVLFELSSLNNIEKTFFCRFILTYIYKLKKANQLGSDEKFNMAIIVDEAHNIFLKEQSNFMNETITDSVYREIREYGISLICLDQHISKLSTTIVGNSACHIAFQQQLPEDIYLISKLNGLHDKEKYFSSLPVGTAIVRLAERFYTPFLIKVEFSELKNKPVEDSFIQEKMSYFNEETKAENDESFIEDLQLDDIQKRLVEEVKKIINNKEDVNDFFQELEEIALQNNYKSPKQDIELIRNYLKLEKVKNKPSNVVTDKERNVYKEENYTNFNKLNEEEQEFVNLLLRAEKNYCTTEIYSILRLSARKGNKIKEQLLEKNIIKIREEKTETGRRKIIELNPVYN